MDHSGIRRLVRRMQDVLRTDAGVDGDAQRLAEIAWLLYFRATSSNPGSKDSSDLSVSWKEYRDRFSLSRVGAVDYTNQVLLPSLAKLSGTSADRARVLEDFRNYVSSDDVLGELIDLVDRVPISGSGDRHIVGDVYEALLDSLKNAKNSGEFYTPRALTRFMAEVLSPESGASILDPAAGTGGFLVSALETVRTYGGDSAAQSISLHAREKKSLPHLLCATNLLLHGCDDTSNVVRVNPLLDYSTSRSPDQKYDFVLANPPFGGEEEPGIDRAFPPEFKTRDTSLLFVLYIVSVLKQGGSAAVILPDGFLFQSGVAARVREHLLTCCSVTDVVRLPRGVFAPYTGIETNILFFRKGDATTSVRFFEHQLPPGMSTYSKTRPITFDEFSELLTWLKGGSPAPAGSYISVPITEIKARKWALDFRVPSTAVTPSLADATSRHRSAREDWSAAVEELRQSLTTPDWNVEGCRTLCDLLPTLTDTLKGTTSLERALLSLSFTGQLQFSGDEKAFERPGWTRNRLEELGRVVGGATPPADDPANFEENGIPWLTPADLRGLEGKFISHGKRSLSQAGFRACSVEILPERTVLFSSRAPIGYVAISQVGLCTNQGFKSLVLEDTKWSDFMFYALKFMTPSIERRAPGTTFKEVSGGMMKKLEVLIPTEHERDAIVKKLDLAMSALLQVRRTLRAELEGRDQVYAALTA